MGCFGRVCKKYVQKCRVPDGDLPNLKQTGSCSGFDTIALQNKLKMQLVAENSQEETETCANGCSCLFAEGAEDQAAAGAKWIKVTIPGTVSATGGGCTLSTTNPVVEVQAYEVEGRCFQLKLPKSAAIFPAPGPNIEVLASGEVLTPEFIERIKAVLNDESPV